MSATENGRPARLAWIDMEMTGLEPERERIIEVAAIVTDGNLEIIAEGPSIVVHQSNELLDAMDDWNKEHHGASGLIERVKASTITEETAEASVLEFLAEHCDVRTAPLAGNSVHQDKRFIAKYMPKLEAFLHYRIVDVSTVKELCRRWYPKEYEAQPRKKGNHRALEDIRESIEELRYYRRAIFKELPAD